MSESKEHHVDEQNAVAALYEEAFGRASILGVCRASPDYARLLDQVEYRCVANAQLNARAYIRASDNRRCVTLNSGCWIVLLQLIDSALEWDVLCQLLPIPALGIVRVRELLLGAALDFIVWHEIQHHGNGHVGYFHRRGDPGFAERGNVLMGRGPTALQMSSMDARACELWADGQAMNVIWRMHHVWVRDRNCRYYKMRRHALRNVFVIAAALLFACIADGEPSMHLYDLGKDAGGHEDEAVASRQYVYPHPSMRAVYVVKQLASARRLSWLHGDRSGAFRTLAFIKPLEHAKVIPFGLMLPFSTEGTYLTASSHQILEHWKVIAPRLMPYGLWHLW